MSRCQLNLDEWTESAPQRLTMEELAALQEAVPSLVIRVDSNSGDKWILKPGSTVGAITVADLSVRIRPKVAIPQLLSLACYAIDKHVRFKRPDFKFPENSALSDALALAIGREARRAFSRGLLHGYVTREEVLTSPRGRIRFGEQIRRRPGILLPIEVRHDEYTDDILANRLVKAAAERLSRAALRSTRARDELRWTVSMLDGVSSCEWPRDHVPDVAFDRLNKHYRNVIALSRLVLRRGEFELQGNRNRGVHASGFLMNMNSVFEEFVTVALREALGLPVRSFGKCLTCSLDTQARLRLEPDLVWRHAGRCVFVGDTKYKNATGGIPSDDIYQMLAYVTSLDLPGGLLIYAEGETEPFSYTVRHSGKQLEVTTLGLDGSLEDVLERVSVIAKHVRRLRNRSAVRKRTAA